MREPVKFGGDNRNGWIACHEGNQHCGISWFTTTEDSLQWVREMGDLIVSTWSATATGNMKDSVIHDQEINGSSFGFSASALVMGFH